MDHEPDPDALRQPDAVIEARRYQDGDNSVELDPEGLLEGQASIGAELRVITLGQLLEDLQAFADVHAVRRGHPSEAHVDPMAADLDAAAVDAVIGQHDVWLGVGQGCSLGAGGHGCVQRMRQIIRF